MKKEKQRSAGFIIVRERAGNTWEFLGLRVWGKIDIPKGHVEPGESDIEAAIRECQEEAGINVVPSRDMKWGDIFYVSERKHKDVIVYLAVTDQDPVILPNPETKQYEHDGYNWLSSEQMKRMSYPYLHGAIDWAREMIESGR